MSSESTTRAPDKGSKRAGYLLCTLLTIPALILFGLSLLESVLLEVPLILVVSLTVSVLTARTRPGELVTPRGRLRHARSWLR
jgi:hypothetical protein